METYEELKADVKEKLDDHLDNIWSMAIFLSDIKTIVERIGDNEETAMHRMAEVIDIFEAAEKEKRHLTHEEKDDIERLKMDADHEMHISNTLKLALVETIKKYFVEHAN